VLSTYYNVQFVAVDVVTLKVFRFGNAACGRAAFLLFSGTHYDAIALRKPDNSELATLRPRLCVQFLLTFVPQAYSSCLLPMTWMH
jgi:hypothetical protein